MSISLGATCFASVFWFWGMEWSRSGQGIIIQHTYARSMIEKIRTVLPESGTTGYNVGKAMDIG